jgi:predicted TIM-barrel fold metal-dependent hydrolase
MRSITLAGALLAVLFAIVVARTVSAETRIPMIDAHSQASYDLDLTTIVPLMNKAGVVRTILAARNRLKQERLVAYAARHPGRITLAVRTKSRVYVKNKPKFYRFLARQLAEPAFKGMAEVLLWHARKGRVAPQIVVPIDAPQVQAVLAATLRRNWPFIAHIEFASAGSDRAPFMAALERLAASHPKHPFGLIHMGQLGAREAGRLLAAHPNVFFLTSHANSVIVRRSRQPWTNMFDGRRIKAEWRELMIRYPARFVLAFDNVFAEHWGSFYLEQAALWRKALAGLPPAVAHAIAHRNAERLWRLPPAR